MPDRGPAPVLDGWKDRGGSISVTPMGWAGLTPAPESGRPDNPPPPPPMHPNTYKPAILPPLHPAACLVQAHHCWPQVLLLRTGPLLLLWTWAGGRGPWNGWGNPETRCLEGSTPTVLGWKPNWEDFSSGGGSKENHYFSVFSSCFPHLPLFFAHFFLHSCVSLWIFNVFPDFSVLPILCHKECHKDRIDDFFWIITSSIF